MMGQFYSTSESRVMFDEESDNGLVLCDKYLPVEVLIEIFCHTDCKTLLRCQLVCKRWRSLMYYVWRKKAEQTLGKPFPWKDTIPWTVFYLTCNKKPYEQNLIQNHSGAEGMNYWEILQDYGDRWTIEEPPVGVPELPQTETMFKSRQTCFVTSYQSCRKMQQIFLTCRGVHPYILDNYQPPIVVSEWYSCRWDCPAIYELEVKLIDADATVMDQFIFKDILQGEKQNKWFKVTHVFENYGRGLRSISFEHVGKDIMFWAGHYGSKMAGACIYVKIPES